MPMPEYKGAWPPEPFDAARAVYDLHSAWLEGDANVLQSFYSQHLDGMPSTRPSQFRGGVVGAVARFFWGRPQKQAMKRLHVPAPADVARTSAHLLFGQPPTWTFNEGDATDLEGAKKRLSQLLDGADVVATFLEAAEIQSALGGVYLRLWWDTSVTDKVMLSAVAPDAAIPEWRYGKLAAVTFWTIVAEDKKGTWRHLERHEPGRIEHALYLGDGDHIGIKRDLGELKATEWAAERPVIETGVKGLTAAYVPNIRPARRWRNVPHLSPLGRSDFEGIEQLFDALDAAYSSWMRDLDLAKARLFVSQQALEDNGPGLGASWDPEQAIFTPVPSDDMDEGGMNQLVQAQQFDIRYEEHAATCQDLMNRIVVSAGYSVGDFGDAEASGMMTATEVSARKGLSNQTRATKILYWQSEAPPLARTMLELDAILFGGGTNYGIKAAPEMVFPVRVDVDPVQQSTAIANLRAARAMSIEQAVRERNPNWSAEEVDDEVKLIKAEMDVVVPDPDGGEFEPATEEPHSDLQGDVEPEAELPEAA